MSVGDLHRLVKKGRVAVNLASSGQQRFDITTLRNIPRMLNTKDQVHKRTELSVHNTSQSVIVSSSMAMDEVEDNGVHLVITSPPYFNTKMYSYEPIKEDLGSASSLEDWISGTMKVWKEVFRVLSPGRKAFINIMNLPIRLEGGSYRTLNLVGRTVDSCESIGLIFKRDIIWHKTNGVRAPFGTYPYPGGILINNMHEFILEFEKPTSDGPRSRKYAHITEEQRESSRLDKDFWLSIKNSDVWTMSPQGSGDRRSHAAPFPIEIPSRIIRAFSFKGETVLDPFVGSGTSLMAASVLGRNGIGYEINPDIASQAITALKMNIIGPIEQGKETT